jgi:hypothetical protein
MKYKKLKTNTTIQGKYSFLDKWEIRHYIRKVNRFEDIVIFTI